MRCAGGGAGLNLLLSLPVFAVGPATAAAATALGFTVATTGASNADALLAAAATQGISHGLHLGGRETTIETGGVISESIAVYASDPFPVAPSTLRQIVGSVAVLHSAGAARRLALLVDQAGIDRGQLTIAAFSAAVVAAAGSGWAAIIVADAPDDARLFAQIAALPGHRD